MTRIFGCPVTPQKTATLDGLIHGSIQIPKAHEFLTLTPVPPKGDVWVFVTTEPPVDKGIPRAWLDTELVTIEYALVGMGQDVPPGYTFRQALITPNGPVFFYERQLDKPNLLVVGGYNGN